MRSRSPVDGAERGLRNGVLPVIIEVDRICEFGAPYRR
jgi:hypothetical protein